MQTTPGPSASQSNKKADPEKKQSGFMSFFTNLFLAKSSTDHGGKGKEEAQE